MAFLERLRTLTGFDVGQSRLDVPQRVVNEIRNQQDSAEILIGWIQLLIISLFGTLYLFAPRAEGGDFGANFVPIALGSYFLFTVVRVVLAHQRLMPNWLVILSIFIDVSLLLGIIFSFHIQYGQHPAFYLKAPTFLYLFLFIALRSLRFDARYVLFTGLVAVIGWVGMLGFAVLSDMDRMRVTRNYVDYITSDAILIGAEIDKLTVIVAVTIILALMLKRGKALLFNSVSSQTAARDLQRFFSADVARSITTSENGLSAGEGETRDVSVLLVDVRGFTGISADLPPETAIRILARYQGLVVPIIEEAGGSVDKFLGDGILATFGAVGELEHCASAALTCAERIIQVMEQEECSFMELGWPGAFSIGLAVDHGQVMVGIVGVAERLEFTVIGDPVNRTAKLEDANKTLGSRFVTSQACFLKAQRTGYVSTLPHQVRERASVAGLPEPLDLVVWPIPEDRQHVSCSMPVGGMAES
ncbi:adenylate/guanylate cyclase domain-containing protein [Coralliovum pocilloporae]|uniref:adenylate/guanylate cyclase domain-containing protein n=1 Tax=Coralliovum pocilloporae TaxID=3066369 RepID=UPI003306EF98